MSYQIRYCLDPQTRLSVVNLIGTRQQLVINPLALSRILGSTRPAVLGSWTVTPAQAVDIGFIVPIQMEASAHDFAIPA
ncbi:hypothetical protein [Paenibacillus odorifer]|uniref:Uncharacterized protein n=1 Tax=Paenibacillus odorifer TaxID=189426 RepID=A0A1R0YA78_9BACL|nr:hypothetical protein [Paenibacillus odorifer]OMD44286.1 hypothetical protein BSK52_01795 [Paenibacillus odorifer]